MKSSINLVICGKIISPFSIDGRLKIKKINFIDDYYKKIKKIYLDNFGFFYLKVEKLEVFKEDFIFKFLGIDSIEDAEKIKNFYLFGKLVFNKIQKDAIIYNINDYKIISDDKENIELLGWEESKGKKYFNVIRNNKEILIPIDDYFVRIDNKNKKIFLKNLEEIV